MGVGLFQGLPSGFSTLIHLLLWSGNKQRYSLGESLTLILLYLLGPEKHP